MRIVALLLVAAMAGCTPSLNSLYTEQDRDFDPALLGAWRSANPRSTDRFDVLRGPGGSYRVEYYESKKPKGTFTVRLVSLGPHRFVDLYPEEQRPESFFQAHFLPIHTFGKITLTGDRLRFGMLDPDWFKTPEARKAGLALVDTKEGGVITSSTAQLREFASRFAETKAFDDSHEWAAYVREK